MDQYIYVHSEEETEFGRYSINFRVPIGAYIWNVHDFNIQERPIERPFKYGFKIYEECNVCYCNKKTAKCKKCVFKMCRTCYDKLESEKCPHCKDVFLDLEDPFQKEKEEKENELKRIKYQRHIQKQQNKFKR